MNNEEIKQAAAMIRIEMITLKSRLTEPFRSNVEACEEAADKIVTEMEIREVGL